MTHHSELINLIAEKIGAITYLEIGVFNKDHNFNKINVEQKVCVDPDPAALADFRGTSDEFWEFEHPFYDLIFIDGLHHADQVKKDIINAWKCLNIGGVIVIHDSNPHSEHITHVPRDNREWTGDVYKTVCNIASPKMTLNFDYGCCVVHKGKEKLLWDNKDIQWDYFNMFRAKLLNLVTVEEGIKIINSWKPIKQKVYADK